MKTNIKDWRRALHRNDEIRIGDSKESIVICEIVYLGDIVHFMDIRGNKYQCHIDEIN